LKTGQLNPPGLFAVPPYGATLAKPTDGKLKVALGDLPTTLAPPPLAESMTRPADPHISRNGESAPVGVVTTGLDVVDATRAFNEDLMRRLAGQPALHEAADPAAAIQSTRADGFAGFPRRPSLKQAVTLPMRTSP
jgi:hypothetical protein